jgi:hypothetical protein
MLLGSPLVHSVCHAEERLSQQPILAQKRGKVLPLSSKGKRKIAVDGNLADWTGVPAGQGVLHQEIDLMLGRPDTRGQDAAAVRLMRDNEALYVAVRVVDHSVVNPYEKVRSVLGDCLELFLDVRPLASSTAPVLGDAGYSDGVYQLLIVPPTPEQKSEQKQVRWLQAGTTNARIGAFQVAGQLLPDGYSIELCISYSSLNRTAASRYNEPIGFNLMVDDKDRGRDDDAVGQYVYSLSELPGASASAAAFAIADPKPAERLTAPYVRFVPPKVTRDNNQFLINTWAIRERTGSVASQPVELQHEYSASAFDLAPLSANDTTNDATSAPPGPSLIVPQPKFLQQKRTLEYPQLGFAVEQTTLDLAGMMPGRYIFSAQLPIDKGPVHRALVYGKPVAPQVPVNSSVPQVRAEPISVGQELEGAALLDALKSQSTLIGLEMDNNFPTVRERSKGSLWIGTSGAVWWGLSLLAAQNGGGNTGPIYAVKVDVVDSSDRVVKSINLPLAQAREHWPLDMGVLDKETYRVKTSVLDPGNNRHDKSTYDGETNLVVMAPRDVVKKTTAGDAPKVLRQAEEIGSPNRERFPKDNAADSYARNVWDLHLYNGRIYIGCGDWNDNRGPIDIWSLGPSTNPRLPVMPTTAGQPQAAGIAFLKEFTVDEESVDGFRDYDGELYVPGTDSRESWALGNLYIKSGDKWTKRRTVPGGIHLFDAAKFKGKLFVTVGSVTKDGEGLAALYESEDDGATWRLSAESLEELRFDQLAPLDDALLVTSYYWSAKGLYRYDGNQMQRLRIPLFPGVKLGANKKVWDKMQRLGRFGAGVVYTLSVTDSGLDESLPLFYLDDFERGAVVVQQFQNEQVRDIVVRDGSCFVLTSKRVAGSNGQFKTQVHSSRDLREWTQIADVTLPAVGKSLEMMDGTYYVGLATGGFPAVMKTLEQAEFGDLRAAGSIWRLKE